MIPTARLLLRPARIDDLPAIHAIMSDAETMRYWSTLPHADVDETRRWLAAMIDGGPDDYVIDLDGVAIGKLGMWRPPEIGFLLDRGLWGSGYAGEALDAFIGHARATGHDHLTADVDPRNAACLRLLARAGFRETGRATATWDVGGQWCDSVYLRRDL